MMRPTTFWPTDQLKKMILVIAGFLLLMSVIRSAYFTYTYGGTDLRSIAVSAKLTGNDSAAYFYRWSQGDEERLINPNVPASYYTNGVTVAPGTLYLLSALNSLPYRALRYCWTVIQYLCVFYVLYFFLFQKSNDADRRFAITACCLLLFLCMPVWFLNIERGQVYTLFLLFFTLIYRFYTSADRWLPYLAGVLIAAAAYCRPNFVVLLIPVLLVFNRKVLAGSLITAIPLGIHAYTHAGLWAGYAAVVKEFSSITGQLTGFAIVPNPVFPETIEGMTNLTRYKSDFVCGGIEPIAGWITRLWGSQPIYFYLILLVLVFAALVLVFRKRLNPAEPATIFLFGFLLFVTTEYIMPANRNSYNLIVWMFPVLLMLHNQRPSAVQVMLMVTGLAFVNGMPFYFPGIHASGELLLIIMLIRHLCLPKLT